MISAFNTIINSFDEEEYKDIESYSQGDLNYIVQNENYLINPFKEQVMDQIKEEKHLSEKQLLKIFPKNDLCNVPPDEHIESLSNRNPPLFMIFVEKKRGRQTNTCKKTQHLSTDFDNLQRKIQVHFFNFIINLCNDAIKAELGSKTPYKFKQINYKLKILISHENVNKLHKLAIKDLLKMEISPKNKKYSKFINTYILNAVCHLSKLLENFFEINYLEFFNDFYFNEEKETNQIIFEGKKIPFSKGTENFYHLLKKNENSKTLLIDSAKSVYFYGYDKLIKKNSFVTSKKDIELNEWNN